jgi:hypothetical protein
MKETKEFIEAVTESDLYQNINFKTLIKTLEPNTLDLVFTDRVCSEVVQDKFLGNPINGHIGISWKYRIPFKIYKKSNQRTEDWINENEDLLSIREKMYTSFKKMTIAYNDLCKYSAESKNAVNIG